MRNLKKRLMVVCALMMVLGMAFASFATAAESVNVQGKVLVDADGKFVLETADQTYTLDGEVEEYEGLQVTVTGTVEDGADGGKVLIVDQIQAAQ